MRVPLKSLIILNKSHNNKSITFKGEIYYE